MQPQPVVAGGFHPEGNSAPIARPDDPAVLHEADLAPVRAGICLQDGGYIKPGSEGCA